METVFSSPNRVRILLLSDVDSSAATKLAEKYVPEKPLFDMIIFCGPFAGSVNWASSPESNAVALGDMACIIASLENIVCRVAYLPSESDPPSSYLGQQYLTPNSVNIHARKLDITEGLYVAGFSETSDNLTVGTDKLREHIENDRDEHDNLGDEIELKSGQSSIEMIEEVLAGVQRDQKQQDQSDNAEHSIYARTSQLGMFVLSHKYAHTLNHFLFCMPDSLEKAGLSLVVIPQAASAASKVDAVRLPSTFGSMHIVVVPSLCQQGEYRVVELLRHGDNGWLVDNVQTLSI